MLLTHTEMVLVALVLFFMGLSLLFWYQKRQLHRINCHLEQELGDAKSKEPMSKEKLHREVIEAISKGESPLAIANRLGIPTAKVKFIIKIDALQKGV
jgi:nitrogen fixation-related uncharacterized protein